VTCVKSLRKRRRGEILIDIKSGVQMEEAEKDKFEECERCGGPIDSYDDYCRHCGTRLFEKEDLVEKGDKQEC